MQCTLTWVVATFLVGINVSETVGNTLTNPKTMKRVEIPTLDSIGVTSNLAQDQPKTFAAKGGYPSGVYNNAQLQLIKNKMAAVNPTNLIVGVMSVNKDKRARAIRLLQYLKQYVVNEESDFATFIDNLIYLIENIRSRSIHLIINSDSTYFEILKKAGKDLSSTATSPTDKLKIFNPQIFNKITSPENSPSADELAFAMYDEFGTEEEEEEEEAGDSSASQYSPYPRSVSRGIPLPKGSD